MLRLTLLFLAALIPAAAQSYRAFWLDSFHAGYKTPAEVEALVTHLESARANAVFVQMRRRADSYFLAGIEPRTEDATLAAGYDPLADLIQKLRGRGIEVHAWFVVYPAWINGSAPKDPAHVWNRHGPRAEGEENWANYDFTGKSGLGLDPGHPAVAAYLIDVFLDCARRYDIDGLHLDYVRYPEDADYGYNPASIARFQRLENRWGPPMRNDARWSAWRREQVTALVRQLYLRSAQLRPELKISAAAITWGNGPVTDDEFRAKDAYSRVFQDWRGWLEMGILDFAMPMNYFAEARNAAFLDRWLEYEKSRQYRRGTLPGLGNYLNTPAETARQLSEVLRPSAQGVSGLGFALYSYASTRSDAPQVPNPEFYSMIGKMVDGPVTPPELPWKRRPTLGHAMGRVEIAGGPAAWRDGLTVRLMPAEGQPRAIRADASGFFGFVDLAPGQYRLLAERNGMAVAADGPFAVEAGRVAERNLRLNGSTLAAAAPQLTAPSPAAAAPGDILLLKGRFLSDDLYGAPHVPLPFELGGSIVLVNGAAAPLFQIGVDFVELQLPATAAPQWEIVLRRAGVESAPIRLEAVASRPAIREIARQEDGRLQILATGLGAVTPALTAGTAAGEDDLRQTVEAVQIVYKFAAGEAVVDASASTTQPWLPGYYRVIAPAPPPLAESVILRVAGRDSEPFQIQQDPGKG